MKKSKFSGSQIVNILKEAEAGVSVEDLSRQYGFSKAKYGGMSLSEVKRMKELEEVNRRLKQMCATGIFMYTPAIASYRSPVTKMISGCIIDNAADNSIRSKPRELTIA